MSFLAFLEDFSFFLEFLKSFTISELLPNICIT
jgi:hypothetical protein